MTLLAVFVAYVGLLYVLSLGLRSVFQRFSVASSTQAVTRVLLGIAAAIAFIFIMRGIEALSLP